MKAYYSIAYGGPEVSRYGELPDPVPSENQLLIKVKAVSLNPVDFKVKRGIAKFMSGSRFPRVFGSDFAGIVLETCQNSKGIKSGDRVYGASPVIWGKPGALAELLAIDPKYVNPVPAEMTFEEAASLPIAALTALNGLRRCGVKQGTEVLINGATGGVGHFAVQIAKAKGAIVTATCRAENKGLASKLGADRVMGYSREELAKCDRRFDAILDAWGKMNLEDACRLLKRGGIYATSQIKPFLFLSSFYTRLLFGKRLTSSNMRSKPEDIKEMEQLFREKKLNPVIENYFTLDKSEEAFELSEHGGPRGKIIIRI